jgi:hypothetical protein
VLIVSGHFLPVLHTALLPISSFGASTLVNSFSSLSMSSTPSLESVSSDSPSLLKYKFFKCHTILPSIINSCIHKRLGTPHVSITFAPDHRSGEDLSSFFEDTEYTKKIPSPPAPPATNSSSFTYEPLTRIQGYVSPKCADYFIWELGVFEEGSKVVLGDNLVLARIIGIVGVVHNFIKFGVETLGSSFRDEIPVKRMIISFSPDIFCLSHSQHFKCFFFPRFLKSMRDFANADRIFEGFDAERQKGLSIDYGRVICDMFGGIDWD